MTLTIKASKVWINKVPAYAGLAVVDAYLGATEPAEHDPLNKMYPGELSPLLNDQFYKTIGVGTRIFLGEARAIAEILQKNISEGRFLLNKPAELLPDGRA